MTDKMRSVQDPPFKHMGIGMQQTFACMGCGKHKPVLGRKLKMFCGRRQWLCAGCAVKQSRGSA